MAAEAGIIGGSEIFIDRVKGSSDLPWNLHNPIYLRNHKAQIAQLVEQQSRWEAHSFIRHGSPDRN